jgi:uncharacterized protein HemY
LHEALKLNDDLPAVHVGLGRLYTETDRQPEAQRHLQRALTLLEARTDTNSESTKLLEVVRGLLKKSPTTP